MALPTVTCNPSAYSSTTALRDALVVQAHIAQYGWNVNVRKAEIDNTELGTKMYIQNVLIHRYINRPQRLP